MPKVPIDWAQRYLQQGKAREARIELQRADHLQPDMPETLYSLGKAAALGRRIRRPPKKPGRNCSPSRKTRALAAQTHFALAGLYRKQGKTADAERETQEFQKLQSPATQLGKDAIVSREHNHHYAQTQGSRKNSRIGTGRHRANP